MTLTLYDYMNRHGHLGLALIVASPLAFLVGAVQGVEWSLVVFGSALLVDRIPDIDQRLPFVSHRGVTHTLIFGIMVSMVLASAVSILIAIPHHSGPLNEGTLNFITRSPMAFAIVFGGGTSGFLAHLFGDVLTEAYDYTVNPFWPVSRRAITYGLVSPDSKRFWDTTFLLIGSVVAVGVIALLRVL